MLDALHPSTPEAADVATAVVARDELSAVFADLKTLPDAPRTAAVLHWVLGVPTAEIAANERVSPRTIESRLRLARIRLRECEQARNLGALVTAAVALIRGVRQRRVAHAATRGALTDAPVVLSGLGGALALSVLWHGVGSSGSDAPTLDLRSPSTPAFLTRADAATRTGAGPGREGNGLRVRDALRGNVAAPATRPGPDRAAGRPFPLPVPHGACAEPAVCVHSGSGSERGHAVYVKPLGSTGPHVWTQVTPVCDTVRDNAVVGCVRGQEPDRWIVKDVPPRPTTPGGTP